jgi:hypothetical protein
MDIENNVIDVEEIIPNEITPSPKLEMTLEDHDKIKALLESGIQAREVFIDYNFPLERAIEVYDELNSVPVIAPTEENFIPMIPEEEILPVE